LRESHPILIADAHDDTRALYVTALVRFGRPIIEARDGREALAAALGSRPALIVTELVLGHVDGFSLCEIVRNDSLTRDVPVIVATSIAAPERLADPRLRVAAAIFVKPVTVEDMRTEAERLLARTTDDERTHDGRWPPPAIRCPHCDRQLVHTSTHVGGLRHDEQWDYFRCWNCSGTFQYRHRTRTLRRA
jgi:CheY-like chemotaxis protein